MTARGVLVHEWLAQTGGSENVFDAMVEAFPDADRLCLWDERDPATVAYDARETLLARTPLRRSKALALPFMPMAWRLAPRGEYDWALVSTHAFAHHVRHGAGDGACRKYLYVHSPARYLWEPTLDVRGAGPLTRTSAVPLKRLDRRRAREAHAVAANSAFVRDRIRRSWGRDATVIHPPVDVGPILRGQWSEQLTPGERASVDALPRPFLLGASRFVAYKKLDVVLRVAAESRLPVVIAGAGPGEEALRGLAAELDVRATFVIAPSTAMLRALYSEAVAFVFPAVEDFGIMPVEAMAAGCPVIGSAVGGVAETVVDGVTGHLVRPERFVDDAVSLLRADLNTLNTLRGPARERAAVFSREAFARAISEFVGVASTAPGVRTGARS